MMFIQELRVAERAMAVTLGSCRGYGEGSAVSLRKAQEALLAWLCDEPVLRTAVAYPAEMEGCIAGMEAPGSIIDGQGSR